MLYDTLMTLSKTDPLTFLATEQPLYPLTHCGSTEQMIPFHFIVVEDWLHWGFYVSSLALTRLSLQVEDKQGER